MQGYGGFLKDLFSTEHDVGSKEAAMKRIQEAQQKRGGEVRTGKPDMEPTESREPSAVDDFYATMREGIIGVQGILVKKKCLRICNV